MGRQLISVALDDTHTVLAEVDAVDISSGDALAPVSRDGHVAAVGASITTALDTVVRPLAQAMFDKMSQIPKAPETVELEFGLKLNAKTGVVIAASEIEGNVKVKLTWRMTT